MTVLRDILVPRSILSSPDTFGGTQQADCLRGDVVITGKRVTKMIVSNPTDTPRMLIPALTEAHCHLDKCHSVYRMPSVGGNLIAAIEAQMADKANWTSADLRHRMSLGLAELVDAGCRLVRSHIDWGTNARPPMAWDILDEVAHGTPTLTIQKAALTSITQMADKDFCEAVARHVSATSNGVLGAFILHHDEADIRKGLANMIAAAARFDLPLDFHVDEGLGAYNGIEAICNAALSTQHRGPILCGHVVSLMNRNPTDFTRIAEKALQLDLSICALPTTNLYLQGRGGGTPDRRGITRLRELHDAGIPIVVASDNVGDAFCPTGQHDPRAALDLAVLTAHLDPPLGDWLPAITTNAARALGTKPVFVDGADPLDLRLASCGTTADLVAGRRALSSVPDLQEPIVP